MQDKIIHIFKSHKDIYISGEDLSKKLGVSRTAIWKHMESLRKDGYVIDAHPHLGYKLLEVPDKLLPEEIAWQLRTEVIGKKIYSYQSLDSTNDTAYKLAEGGCPEGAIILAEEQKSGKGRMGRRWNSPGGFGIYLSCVLRPDIAPNEASKITLLAAISVARAIRNQTHLACLIRWPNDILVDSKKICGILTEMKAEQDNVAFLILGIGVNVNTPMDLLPKGASSIKELLQDKVSRIELAKKILEELDFNYQVFMKDGFEPFVGDWDAYSAINGKRVKLTCHDKAIEGIAQGIDDNGALIVRLDNGFLERVLAGDVTLLR